MDRRVNALPIPTVSDVDRIAAIPDPVLRNLQITQCYYELSAALVNRTGICANWCTFATWASRQAGQSIRKDDLYRFVQGRLRSTSTAAVHVQRVAALSTALGSKSGVDESRGIVWKALNLAPAVERTSRAVARGNVKVFEEIGREFARFFALCLNDETPDPAKIAAFCDELRPGEPPDGQMYLRQAFSHLYLAMFETDLIHRAQLALLANIEIGFHEQTRLQPEIQEALETPYLDVTEFLGRLLGMLFPEGSRLIRIRAQLMKMLGRPTALELAVRGLLAAVREALHLAVTEAIMSIRLPGDVILRLGRDLSGDYPLSLKELTNQELRERLKYLDPTPDSLLRSGAVDWSDLAERLHYIADMFRLYHETAYLFEPPFTEQQVQLLKDGKIPAGVS